jgi:large conductance mechanosensitive channel
MNGFREFILRGNAIDLAVGVVIGGAFTALVTAIVNLLLTPLIAAIFGKPNFDDLWDITIRGAYTDVTGQDVPASVISVGGILTAVISLLIIAVALYFFVIVPVNKLAELRKQGEEPEPEAPAEHVLLLQEIRDLLAAGTGRSTPNSPSRGPSA